MALVWGGGGERGIVLANQERLFSQPCTMVFSDRSAKSNSGWKNILETLFTLVRDLACCVPEDPSSQRLATTPNDTPNIDHRSHSCTCKIPPPLLICNISDRFLLFMTRCRGRKMQYYTRTKLRGGGCN